MKISVFWHKPIRLEDGSKNNLIYNITDLNKFEEIPGVYMFCRSYGDNISPLYIGKANNLASRIRQQFNTTNELINQKGTKTPFDRIEFDGNRTVKNFTRSQIYKKKGRV